MQQIMKYMDRHQDHIANVFQSMAKQDAIEATQVFNFIQNSFNQEQFIFQLYGKDFFSDDENTGAMQKLLESYYRQTQQDPSKKFYLYRVQFTLLEIKYILEFWLNKEPQLKIIYNEGNQGQLSKKEAIKTEEEDGNQFDIDNQRIPTLIKEYQQQIQKYQEQLAKGDKQEEETKAIIKTVEDINYKIKVLEQRLKAQNSKNYQQNGDQTEAPNKDDSKNKGSQNKLPHRSSKIDFQAIFQFYAKQNHLTGVKATFDRIEHETQSINYQKLVHFLREFSLMPIKTGDQKKIYILYIKNCDKTRDLNLEGFKRVLTGVAEMIFADRTVEQRQQLLKDKLLMKKVKGLKLLNNPFHSLQKQDFRINQDQLTYNFKLKPQDGKLVSEIVEELEMRKKVKQEEKNQREKVRELKKIRQLKKLQSIDPFNPQVLKNSQLLSQKEEVEPIATLENMEKYRDNSFDFQSLFGIKKQDRKTPRNHSFKQDSSVDIGYRRGQDTLKKVEKLERYEMDKMASLMNGIIQRSNAKMQKLGLSPQKSVKFN